MPLQLNVALHRDCKLIRFMMSSMAHTWPMNIASPETISSYLIQMQAVFFNSAGRCFHCTRVQLVRETSISLIQSVRDISHHPPLRADIVLYIKIHFKVALL